MNAVFAVYPKLFPLQSYFSSTLGIQALIQQAPGSGIVAPDRQPTAKGTFVGLHPDSQTPVALRPMSVGGSVAGQPIILVPGQVMRIDINGFEWGLPFGWLGGGLAHLVVANNKDAFLNWPLTKTEVLVQRFRAIIQADAEPASLAYAVALPNRFPWVKAYQQSGQPLIAPEPTKMSLRLRVNNLAAPADMRLVIRANDDFDTGADGLTPATTDFTYVDVTFPMAVAGALSVAFPVIEVNMPARLGGDLAQLALVDLTGSLTDAYVDILRYGKI